MDYLVPLDKFNLYPLFYKKLSFQNNWEQILTAQLLNILWLLPLIIFPITIGRLALKLLHIEIAQRIDFCYEFAIGLIFYSFGILILAALQILYPVTVVLLLLFSILPLSFDRSTFNLFRFKAISKFIIQLNIFQKILMALLAVMIILNLLSCLPPSTDYDDTGQHFAYSKLYVDHRGYFPKYDHWMMLTMPKFMEMLNVYGIIFNIDVIARLLYFLIYLFLSYLIYIITRGYADKSSALLATVVFVYSESIAHWVRTAHVDIPMAFFVLLIILALKNWEQKGKLEWLYLSFVFSSVTLSIKYPGIFVLIMNAFFALLLYFYKKTEISLKQLIYILIIVIILGCPYYFFCYLSIGTIFFPIFGDGHFFNGALGKNMILSTSFGVDNGLFIGFKGIDQTISTFITVAHRTVSLLFLPWKLSINFKPYGYPIGPIFLAVLPGYLLVKKSPFINWILICAVSFVAFIYLLMGEQIASRYFIPILPLLCISLGYVLCQIKKENLLVYYLIMPLIAFIVLFNGVLIYRQISRAFPYMTGHYNSINYLAKTNAHPWGDKLEYIKMYDYINKKYNGLSTKILLDKDLTGYYLNNDYCDYGMLRMYSNIKFDESVFRKLGITHRLFYSGYWGKHPIPLSNRFTKDGVVYQLDKKITTKDYDFSFYKIRYAIGID